MAKRYPPEHKGPKSIVNQIKALAAIFGLNPTQALEYAKNLPTLPEGAEGWFAIPRWQKIAQTYGEAVEKVLAAIVSSREFHNYRDGALGEGRLRQHDKTAEMFQKLGDEQRDSDILVVAAQFGKRHAGRSFQNARSAFVKNEFGLGAFAVGIMLLTHSEREVRWGQLHIDCTGDEYASDASDHFSGVPFFDFIDGRVRFSADWCSGTTGSYGSASAFVLP